MNNDKFAMIKTSKTALAENYVITKKKVIIY